MTWSSRSITTKIESDLKDKECLYCQNAFRLNCEGEHDSHGTSFFLDTYTCTECNECFMVKKHPNDELISLYFTCNDIKVGIDLQIDKLVISNADYKAYQQRGEDVPFISVPVFPLDFTDKDKLHQKLRTYLIFS